MPSEPQSLKPVVEAPVQPWERRSDETAPAHGAFVEYLKMGPQRAVRAVGRKLHKSSTIIGRWSRRHDWQERVAAWDSEQFRIQVEAEIAQMRQEGRSWAERSKQIREQEFLIGRKLLEKAQVMINWPLGRQTVRKGGRVTIIEPAQWNMHSAARFVDLASILMRRGAALPTNLTSFSAPDGSALPVAPAARELSVLEKIAILQKDLDEEEREALGGHMPLLASGVQAPAAPSGEC